MKKCAVWRQDLVWAVPWFGEAAGHTVGMAAGPDCSFVTVLKAQDAGPREVVQLAICLA